MSFFNNHLLDQGTLLFETTGTLKGVFSFRKIIGAYSGFCCRVRRGSDSTEMDIPFFGDYVDTAAITTFVNGSTAYLMRWYNQTNGAFLFADTTAKMPQIVTGFNSKLTARFAGAQFMAADLGALSQNLKTAVNTVTANIPAGSNNMAIASSGAYGAMTLRANYAFGANYTSAVGGGGGNINTTVPRQTAASFTSTFEVTNTGANLGDIKGYINGVITANAVGAPVSAHTAGILNIGNANAVASDWLTGDVFEIVKWDGLPEVPGSTTAEAINNIIASDQRAFYSLP